MKTLTKITGIFLFLMTIGFVEAKAQTLADIQNNTDCSLTWTNTQNNQYVIPSGQTAYGVIETTGTWTVTDGTNTVIVSPTGGCTAFLTVCNGIDICLDLNTPIRMYKGLQRR